MPGSFGLLNAGPGDDVVVNESGTGPSDSMMTVYLGEGDDTFTGAPMDETVFADTDESGEAVRHRRAASAT